MSEIVVSSRVRLARNYADIPFRPKANAEQGEECVRRTLDALRELPEIYRFVQLRSADDLEKAALVESHLISPDLTEHDAQGAALIRQDQRISVMINEEDHLRIQVFGAGEQLQQACEDAFAIEDVLQRRLTFAFDRQLGYLTACPTNIGTGLRASVMLHLPMLTILKQMGKVNQLAAKLGLTIRGIYGEGSEARGYLYQLSNQVTLGRTEQEILEAVQAVARQLTEMEKTFREKTWEKDSVGFADQLQRSYGLMRFARRMPEKEFMVHWSNLRMGAAMGKLPLSLTDCDRMLISAQPGHVQQAAGRILEPKELNEKRSDFIRAMLSAAEAGQ